MSEWTNERIEEASRLWLSGVSALQIAERLGGLTRNAVIGKINRLGLMRASRGEAAQSAAPAANSIVVPETRVEEVKPAVVPPEAAPARPVRILPSILAPVAAGVVKEKPGRAEAPRRSAKPAPIVRQSNSQQRPAVQAASSVKAKDGEETTVRIMDLRDYMCKWPLGDPGAENFRYCGHRSKGGTPYCEAHARLAYMPTAPRLRSATRPAATARK